MGNNQVFVDTSMFFALINENDEFHNVSVNILKKLQADKALLITSNYILDETFTILRLRRGIKIVDNFRKSLTNQYEVKIVRVTVADEAKAWEWFLKDWAKLSFTDCVSFATMIRLNLKHVATFDTHFQKAGFQIKK